MSNKVVFSIEKKLRNIACIYKRLKWLFTTRGFLFLYRKARFLFFGSRSIRTTQRERGKGEREGEITQTSVIEKYNRGLPASLVTHLLQQGNHSGQNIIGSPSPVMTDRHDLPGELALFYVDFQVVRSS